MAREVPRVPKASAMDMEQDVVVDQNMENIAMTPLLLGQLRERNRYSVSIRTYLATDSISPCYSDDFFSFAQVFFACETVLCARLQSLCIVLCGDCEGEQQAGWEAQASHLDPRPYYIFNILDERLRCAATAQSSPIHTHFAPPFTRVRIPDRRRMRAPICARLHARGGPDLRTPSSVQVLSAAPTRRRCSAVQVAARSVAEGWRLACIDTGWERTCSAPCSSP